MWSSESSNMPPFINLIRTDGKKVIINVLEIQFFAEAAKDLTIIAIKGRDTSEYFDIDIQKIRDMIDGAA